MKSRIYIILDLPIFALNYIFLVLAAKVLSSIDFGTLNSLLSILAIVFIVGLTLQTLISKDTNQHIPTQTIHLYTLLAGLSSLSLSLIFSFNFKLTSILLLLSITHPLCSAGRGLFIQKGQYQLYYQNIYIEIVSKLLLLFIAVYLDIKDLTIILSTILASQLFASIHAYKLNSKNIRKKTAPFLSLNSQIPIVVNQLAFFLMVGVDFLLVNKYFPDSSGNLSLNIRFCQVPLMLLFTYIQFDLMRLKKQKSLTSKYVALIPITFIFLFLSLFIIGNSLVSIFFNDNYRLEFVTIAQYCTYYVIMSYLYTQSVIDSLRRNTKSSLFIISYLIFSYLIVGSLSNSITEYLNTQIICTSALSATYFILKNLKPLLVLGGKNDAKKVS